MAGEFLNLRRTNAEKCRDDNSAAMPAVVGSPLIARLDQEGNDLPKLSRQVAGVFRDELPAEAVLRRAIAGATSSWKSSQDQTRINFPPQCVACFQRYRVGTLERGNYPAWGASSRCWPQAFNAKLTRRKGGSDEIIGGPRSSACPVRPERHCVCALNVGNIALRDVAPFRFHESPGETRRFGKASRSLARRFQQMTLGN
jgi:hypothetical protein